MTTVRIADLGKSMEAALLRVDRLGAEAVIRDGLLHFTADDVTDGVITAALDRIGTAWESGDVALSQVFMASRIAEEIVGQMFPPNRAGATAAPTTAIAVLEDFHMLGKRMVKAAMAAAGLAVVDYGRVTVDSLVDKVKEDGVAILMVSTLMLRSALRIEALRRRLDAETPGVKLLVGGAPFRFDAELWRAVGADAMGANAADAVRLVLEATP